MLARLIRTGTGKYLLCPDGTIAAADKELLWRLFNGFASPGDFSGEDRWDIAHKKMGDVEGHTLAEVDTRKRLVIHDPSAFNEIIVGAAADEYVTATEYAQMLGKTVGRIKKLCQENRIAGVVRKGGQWLIPRNAAYPADARCKKQ